MHRSRSPKRKRTDHSGRASDLPGILHGWKEVAQYLHCCIRTAKKYYYEGGIPIMAGMHMGVRALPVALDFWMMDYCEGRPHSRTCNYWRLRKDIGLHQNCTDVHDRKLPRSQARVQIRDAETKAPDGVVDRDMSSGDTGKEPVGDVRPLIVFADMNKKPNTTP